MAGKVISSRVFEDYEPPSDLVTEEQCDTLLIYLPGFKKHQMRVQLSISGVLKISGERPVGDHKYKRFNKEFRVASNCDTKNITAKFEGGILHIRQPKHVTPAATATPHPQLQHQVPPPQPQAQALQEVPESEAPQKAKEEEVMKKKEEVEEEMGNKGGKGEKSGEIEEARRKLKVVKSKIKSDQGLYRELRKPHNMKKLGVCVTTVLIIGFFIPYMLKSFMGSDHQG